MPTSSGASASPSDSKAWSRSRGGIALPIVDAAMAQAQAEAVRRFPVGFPDTQYDERPYAREIAERYGTRHEELEIEPAPDLDRLARVFDEPFGDEAALPLLHIC